MDARLLEQSEVSEGLTGSDVSTAVYTTTLADRDTLSGYDRKLRIIQLPARRPSFVIENELGQPSWIMWAVRAAQQLLSLPENWDSYGARPVKPEAVVSALELLSMIMRLNTPLPEIVPTIQGGVQLEWHTRDIDLEIEVEVRGRYCVCYQDHRTGTEWEKEITSNLAPLNDCILELSRR